MLLAALALALLLALGVAVAAGLLLSPVHLNPHQPLLAPFFEAFRMIGGAITILACLILALNLNFRSLRGLLPLPTPLTATTALRARSLARLQRLLEIGVWLAAWKRRIRSDRGVVVSVSRQHGVDRVDIVYVPVR